MGALCEGRDYHRGEGLPGVSFPLKTPADDAADLPGPEIPAPAVDVADDLSRVGQRRGKVFLRADPLPQMLPRSLPRDAGIALEFVVPELGQEFKQIVQVRFPEGPQEEPGGPDLLQGRLSSSRCTSGLPRS